MRCFGSHIRKIRLVSKSKTTPLGAGAQGRPRGMVWRGRREEGSGWGTHVY